MNATTGGPAFPHGGRIVGYSQNDQQPIIEPIVAGGMTLRDYFAASALTMLADSEAQWNPTKEEKDQGLTWVDLVARQAYLIADAMLAKRNRK